jgi:hypothetical protein
MADGAIQQTCSAGPERATLRRPFVSNQAIASSDLTSVRGISSRRPFSPGSRSTTFFSTNTRATVLLVHVVLQRVAAHDSAWHDVRQLGIEPEWSLATPLAALRLVT